MSIRSSALVAFLRPTLVYAPYYLTLALRRPVVFFHPLSMGDYLNGGRLRAPLPVTYLTI